MLEKFSRFVTWPVVALFAIAGATFAAIAIFAPPETRTALFGANGLIATAIALWMESPFAQRRPAPRASEPAADDDPTPAISPRAMQRRDRPPGGFAVPSILIAIATVFGLAIAASLLSGCSPSALQVHATILDVAGSTLDAGCHAEELARDRDQRAAANAHATREEAATAVAQVRAHYDPVLLACAAAADVHDAWIAALAIGAAGGPFDPLAVGLRFAPPLADFWRVIAVATEHEATPVPPPPPVLLDLIAQLGTGSTP